MKISPISMAAFVDEVVKTASIMTNVGNAIVHHSKGIGKNIGNTMLKGVRSPLSSAATGAKDLVREGMTGGAMGKAMLGLQGVATVAGVNDVRKSKEEAGTGRGERIGKLIGTTGGGFIGQSHGASGQIAGSLVAEKVLGTVGKGADKLVDKFRRKPQAAPVQAQVPPAQVQPG